MVLALAALKSKVPKFVMVFAVTASENVKVCPPILVMVPKAPFETVPTAPVNVTLPEPDPKVKLLAWLALLFTVVPKVIVFDVAVSVRVVQVPEAA